MDVPLPEAGADLSTELVKRIHDGDDRAWEDLYLRYRDQLLFSIRCRLGRQLRTRLESEDILHSVFREALSDLARFEPRGAGSLHHYLHVCALNKIRSKAAYFAAQKRARAVPLSPSLAARIPAIREGLGYVEADRYEQLEKNLALLPEAMREAILLRHIEGLSNQETAAALGKSSEATSKIYNRGIARLARLSSSPSPD